MNLAAKTACLLIALMALGAIFAPLIAPFDPLDAASLSLWDAKQPPFWLASEPSPFWLGTDTQGRDLFSAILYGLRLSLLVAVLAVGLGLLLGCATGLAAGYAGGWADALLLRAADSQLALPGLLLAILFNGIARAILPLQQRETAAFWVVVLAIGLTDWPQFARVTRNAVRVESAKDYVSAARLLGLSRPAILLRHILPNVLRPVLVLATISFALAVTAEATLSFLGQGLPPTTPSLGTLIRSGSDYLYSGLWWIFLFPALTLFTLVLAANVLGDWLRDRQGSEFR